MNTIGIIKWKILPLNTEHGNIIIFLGVRYYLNIDRCAYGSLRDKPDKFLGLKAVFGPNIYALNQYCNESYFFDGRPPGKWRKYLSTPATTVQCCPTSLPSKCVRREKE